MIVLVIIGAGIGLLATPAVILLARALAVKGIQPVSTSAAKVVMAIACAVAGAAVATLDGPITVGFYWAFAGAILAAAAVDAVEHRIPNKITYPLITVGVLVLPVTSGELSWWVVLAPAVGAVAAGLWGLLIALIADQGLGDVKLTVAIGGWMAHLGVLPWAAGILGGQILVAVLVGATVVRRRRAGITARYTALGPALAAGAILAVVSSAAV